MPLKVEPLRRHKMPTPAEALTYRISMPVSQIFRLPGGDSYPVCPRCGSCLDREYLGFCNCCGQKLSWAGLPAAKVYRHSP